MPYSGILIRPLTSLRFFFALMVLALHYFDWTGSYDHKEITQFFVVLASCGVSFFFILSGYILSYSSAGSDFRLKNSRTVFWIHRLARVYPLYLLTILLTIPYDVLHAHSWAMWLGKLGLCIAGLQSFFLSGDITYAFNPVSWSVSCEFFFYLVFPFLILWLHSRKSGLLPIYIILVIAGSFLIPDKWGIGIYVNPMMRVADFMLGMILFRLDQYKPVKLSYIMATIAELSGIAAFSAMLMLTPKIPANLRFGIAFWPTMILILWSFSKSKGAISAFLSHRIFVYLGNISYPFFLLQHIVAVYLIILDKRIGLFPNKPAFIATHFLLLLILSAVVHEVIEIPCNRFLRNWLPHSKKVQPA